MNSRPAKADTGFLAQPFTEVTVTASGNLVLIFFTQIKMACMGKKLKSYPFQRKRLT